MPEETPAGPQRNAPAPARAGRLRRRPRLVLPVVRVRCPQGHQLRPPAQYVAEGREIYCPRCRRSFIPGGDAELAARHQATVFHRVRRPVPPAMEPLYSDARGWLPDSLRPRLRRALRAARRAADAAAVLGGRFGRLAGSVALRLARFLGAGALLTGRKALSGVRRMTLRPRATGRKPGRPPAPPVSARQLAAFQELARAFPAVAERLRPVMLPETPVECPRGHRLSVLADIAASGREIFCPQCRAAFRPAAGPAGPVEVPKPIEDTKAAPPVRRTPAPGSLAAALLGRRPESRRGARASRSRLARALSRISGWMISCVLHSLLLLVAMLMGIKVTGFTRLEESLVLDASIEPPREYDAADVSAHRDLFKRELETEKGAESVQLDRPLVAPELETTKADEVTDDASLRPMQRSTEELLTPVPETPETAMANRRGQILSLRSPQGMGLTTPAPTGNYDPGVTAGLGAGILDLRGDEETRLRAAGRRGGGADTEEAVALALKWLADRQKADGSWAAVNGGNFENPYCLAGTGLAALAFLGAGNSGKQGPYRKNVARAVDWLVANQQKEGCWSSKSEGQQMHAQGIAALALCEAYMMAPTGEDGEKLRESAQRAVDFIVKGQCPYSVWGYNPYPGGKRSFHVENSVVIWNGMALKAARTVGLRVDEKAFLGMARWLDQAQVEARYAYAGTYDGDGKTAGDGGAGSPCMIASSMMMRFWTGTRPGQRHTAQSANIVLAQLRTVPDPEGTPRRQAQVRAGGVAAAALPEDRRAGLYFLHHGTIAMFQMGGRHWEEWNPRMKRLVLHDQYADGHWAGFCGDVMSTALGALILESYYRYSPLYEGAASDAAPPAEESGRTVRPAAGPAKPAGDPAPPAPPVLRRPTWTPGAK